MTGQEAKDLGRALLGHAGYPIFRVEPSGRTSGSDGIGALSSPERWQGGSENGRVPVSAERDHSA